MKVEADLKESQAIPLFNEKQRLQKELENLQAHSHWLEQELDAKGKDNQRLIQSSRDRQLQLQTHLQVTENEKIEATAKNDELNELQNRLHDQVEKLTLDLKMKTQDLIALRESTDLEVQHERDLMQKQQDQLVRWEDRYNDVVRENESLKAAAGRAADAAENDMESIRKEMKEKYEKLLREQAEELQQATGRTRAALAAPMTDDEDDSVPTSVTEAFERLERTKAELRATRHRAEKAELLKQRLLADIQDKTPM